MRGFVYSTVSAAAMLAVLSAGASAADFPQPADPAPYQDVTPEVVSGFDWTGPYAGVSLGWGLGTFTTRSAVTGEFDNDASNLVGGVYTGYNFMLTPNILAGAEADFNFTNQLDSSTVAGVTYRTRSAWNASLRGRLGYAFDRFMVYGTGGLAMADVNVRANGVNDDDVALGWTLGAGIESAVTDNVTVRLDYAYQDFERQDFSLGGTNYSTDLDNNVIRAGIAYKF